MDGARLFNACAVLLAPPSRVARDCNSVSVCFSKGLSAPVGSTLVGSYHFIQQARRVRKALGGGMRQAGVLAAAAIVALDETFSVDVEHQHTNMVFVKISADSPLTPTDVVQRLGQVSLAETQVECGQEAKTVRFVLHREIGDEELWLAIMKITYVFKELDATV
ncbi:Uncharacterized protein OBRU01_13109 [Operophtera brumata]|uniref:Aromatic amino acid beta-eliminating lyase/threonine aldolase domain-containing protein n=1 Tax=Operophtera brumata TaxID=104452 RepID=A0A0L7L8G7_OPEBR|nr:Uncharacterized protein OBRU01_13109 [Operophtera brumata]